MTLNKKELSLLFCVLRGSYISKINMANHKRTKQNMSTDVVSPMFTALITFLMSSLENMIDTIMAKHVEGLFTLLRNFFEAAKHMEENRRVADGDDDDDDDDHDEVRLTRQPPSCLAGKNVGKVRGGKRQRPGSSKQHDLEPPMKKAKSVRGKPNPGPSTSVPESIHEVDEVDLSQSLGPSKKDKAKELMAKEAFMSSAFDMPDLTMPF